MILPAHPKAMAQAELAIWRSAAGKPSFAVQERRTKCEILNGIWRQSVGQLRG
jgi:hypothetical protein